MAELSLELLEADLLGLSTEESSELVEVSLLLGGFSAAGPGPRFLASLTTSARWRLLCWTFFDGLLLGVSVASFRDTPCSFPEVSESDVDDELI